MEEENISLSESLNKDLEYIKGDIIAKQPNGNYTKWSKALRAVSAVNLSYKSYIEFWERKYKSEPELAEIIIEACIDKLENGTIPAKQMMDMIYNSKDFDSEKAQAIEALGGRYEY